MKWNIAQAREQFSQVVKDADTEPQLIYNRDEPVAALINIREFREFQSHQKDQEQVTLSSSFSLLRDICNEEQYQVELPSRLDREFQF